MTARWITAALLLVASPGAGQDQAVLEPGAKVRVADSAHIAIGIVQSFDSTQLSVAIEFVELREPGALPRRPDERLELSWSLEDIESLERHTKGPTRFWRGATLGGAIGGGSFGLLAAAAAIAYCSDSDCSGGEPALFIAGSTVAGALTGGLIGGAIGAVSRQDIWQPVQLPAKPIIAVQPTGRLTVAFTIPVRR
jgi:hypothetical protein